jgi:hypothetical protein
MRSYLADVHGKMRETGILILRLKGKLLDLKLEEKRINSIIDQLQKGK